MAGGGRRRGLFRESATTVGTKPLAEVCAELGKFVNCGSGNARTIARTAFTTFTFSADRWEMRASCPPAGFKTQAGRTESLVRVRRILDGLSTGGSGPFAGCIDIVADVRAEPRINARRSVHVFCSTAGCAEGSATLHIEDGRAELEGEVDGITLSNSRLHNADFASLWTCGRDHPVRCTRFLQDDLAWQERTAREITGTAGPEIIRALNATLVEEVA